MKTIASVITAAAILSAAAVAVSRARRAHAHVIQHVKEATVGPGAAHAAAGRADRRAVGRPEQAGPLHGPAEVPGATTPFRRTRTRPTRTSSSCPAR